MSSRLKSSLARAGGLVSKSGLARRWGVSPERVRQLAAMRGFPEPVDVVDGRPVYLAGECDRWRASRPGPGRPRKS